MAQQAPRSITARIGEGGRLVIPAELRRRLGLGPGVRVVLTETADGELQVSTPAAGLRRAHELVRRNGKPSTSLTDDLLAERRREAPLQ